MPKPENRAELQELKSISKSRAFYNLLAERKKFAQKEVNRHVKGQSLIEAYAALAKYEDINRLLTVIGDRITKLEKEEK